jgi:hypothetical protein
MRIDRFKGPTGPNGQPIETLYEVDADTMEELIKQGVIDPNDVPISMDRLRQLNARGGFGVPGMTDDQAEEELKKSGVGIRDIYKG